MRPQLENELLSVRLYAARQAESPDQLRSSRLPRVVMWWALARLGFTSEPGPRWLVRRRMVQRRRKLSRFECLASFRAAEHPLACLAHAARLVELHGQDAIPALLEVLPRVARSREHGEAVAWALGTLGRPILAETLACARSASAMVRQWLLLALWFLGPEAHGAEKDLLTWNDPMAEAVLLNLESRAAARVARDGRAEVVYLDQEAVLELAGQVYGHEPLERRRRAVRALKGFGPFAHGAVKLLSACLDVPELSASAARTLVDGHPDEALRLLLRDGGYLNEIARLGDLSGKLKSVVETSEELRPHALRAAHQLAISIPGLAALIPKLQGEARWLALREIEPGELSAEALALCASDPHPCCRLAATRLLSNREPLLELTRDSDPEVALEARLRLLRLFPADEELAVELLLDTWTRRRVMARLGQTTPALVAAQQAGRLPAREDLAQDGPQLNTYTSHELVAMLEQGQDLHRLKLVANADLLVELMLERADRLPPALISQVLREVGPRLEEPGKVRALLEHVEPELRAAAQELLGPDETGRTGERELLVGSDEAAFDALFGQLESHPELVLLSLAGGRHTPSQLERLRGARVPPAYEPYRWRVLWVASCLNPGEVHAAEESLAHPEVPPAHAKWFGESLRRFYP